MNYFLGQKRKKFHILIWFRVLIWWGSEMVRHIIQTQKPQAQIQYVFQNTYPYPKSLWGITSGKVFCLILRPGTKQTHIHLFPEQGHN